VTEDYVDYSHSGLVATLPGAVAFSNGTVLLVGH
jgi:hypothetical protein